MFKPKKEEEEETHDSISISQEMTNAIKEKIKEYPSYYDFLYAVKAMEDRGGRPVVLKHKNELLREYEEKFIKRFKKDITDEFIFTKMANYRKNIANDGKPKWVDTGYFIPRSFWDFVERQKNGN